MLDIGSTTFVLTIAQEQLTILCYVSTQHTLLSVLYKTHELTNHQPCKDATTRPVFLEAKFALLFRILVRERFVYTNTPTIWLQNTKT